MAVTPPVPPGPRAPRIQYWEAVPSLGVCPRSLLGGMVARKTCLGCDFSFLFYDRSIGLPRLPGKQRMHFLSKVE